MKRFGLALSLLAIGLALPAAAQPAADRDTVFWQSVQGSRDPAELQEYLRQFPDGLYAGLARLRLGTLTKAQAPAAPVGLTSAAPAAPEAPPVVDTPPAVSPAPPSSAPAVIASPPVAPDVVVPAAAVPESKPDTAPAPTKTTGPAEVPAPDSPPAPQVAEAPQPLLLEHPSVIDTAKLASGTTTVALFGVVGVQGQFAQDLHGFIAASGDIVTCMPQASAEHICMLADGTDLAAAALRNGVAQSRADASDFYHEMESLARDERRGIWRDLPPPPVPVTNPMVTDTATLAAADGKIYRLDGVLGLGGTYARDLKGYIAATGDALMCNPQGSSGTYICLTPDGTDLAKVALVNGAARVGPAAPDSYRLEQRDALANRRGYWSNPPPDVLLQASRPVVSDPSIVLVAGDDGSDGVTYIGGAPAAVIEGATVFLAFAGAAGWGYWDNYHRWHRAPGHMHSHMERFHPGGSGLRGGGGGPRPGGFAGGGMRPGVAPPQHGGGGGGFVRPAAAPGFAPRPMAPAGGGFHAPAAAPRPMAAPHPVAAPRPAPAAAPAHRR